MPSALLAVAALCAADPARAHAGEPTIAFGWSFEPWVLACLALSAAGYGLGAARLWRHAGRRWRGITAGQGVAFVAGWLVLAAALVSPLDTAGARLFVAHMLQHEALMVVAAPLFVLARPLVAWTWALPPPARRVAGRLTRHGAWQRPWRFATAPLPAFALHALVLWGWHAPRLFDAALEHPAVHVLQHASFLATALLFWWSVLGTPARHAGGCGLAVASLFATLLHTGALGALLTLSTSPWYATYRLAAAGAGLDPLEDQQLGGLVMWIPAGFAYCAAGLALMARLLRPALPPGPRPLGRAHVPPVRPSSGA